MQCDRVGLALVWIIVGLGGARMLVAGFVSTGGWWKLSLALIALQLACLAAMIIRGGGRPARRVGRANDVT